MSEKSRQLQMCRFCQRKMKVLFYCEECGVACCSDCLRDDFYDYYICQSCNSKEIEINESEGKKFCKQCNSENIIKNTQHLKSCPKCHSHKIINIYEKKEALEQKFLELIKNSRTIIKPLRDVINELYLIRHKVKKAREPPIKCYHYPKMESQLLALFKAVIYVKENLVEKIKGHFRHLFLNKEYYFDIYHQPNSNVRIIESILETLLKNYESIENFVVSNAKDIADKFEGFQKKILFIERITKLFLPYQQFLKLAEDEKPVYAIKTKLINGLNPQSRFKKSKGILFITNFDLSFVQESGLIKKKKDLIFKAPVDDLIKIKDKGKLFKKLFVQFDYGKYEFSLPSNLVSKIIDYILLAQSFRDNEIVNKETTKELFEMDLDLNDIIKYIEEGINKFFSIKCEYNQNDSIDENNREFEKEKSLESNQAFFKGIPNEPEIPYYYTPNRNQYYPSSFVDDYTNPIHHENPHFNREYDPRNNFYRQDIHSPNRVQNYEPNWGKSGYKAPNIFNRVNVEDRINLMKILERSQKLDQNEEPYMNMDQRVDFTDIPPYNNYEQEFINRERPSYVDYRKNHLSELFEQNNFPTEKSFTSNNPKYQENNYRFQILELKRERFSLVEMLKKLDATFKKGIISKVEYFKTFKNLQKDLYLVNKKLKDIRRKQKEEMDFRSNFDKKRYSF